MNIEKLKKAAEKLDKKKLPEEKTIKIKVEKQSISNVPDLATLIQNAAKLMKEKGVKKKKSKGLEIPAVISSKVRGKKFEVPDLSKVDIVYPLIPQKPKRGEYIYAYAHITWNKTKNILRYEVIEPELNRNEKILLERVKETIQERLDIDFTKLNLSKAREYLDERFNEVLNFLGITLDVKKREKFQYYLYRDFIGIGKIEPLMHDPYIEDISCDGVGIPIYVYHRNPFFGSIETNVVFETKEELDSFVMKLAQRGEKSISMAEPLVDASLPDGSRIQVTFGTDIAKRGSNFTIRKFTEKPMTPVDLINFGTIDSKILAYLWFCIEHGKSILVSGGTATGKTTMLNVLSMFIKPNMKVISIEDTPELKFSHPHWISEVARQPISEVGGKGFGQVDLYDLLKESLRQRPDYLIVGEVRGKEAYVLFQQMVTGHPGLSTIHAENIEKLMDRLTTEPINLSPSLIENLDIIIFLKRVKRGSGYLRRISEILEMERYDKKEGRVVVNKVFEWNPVTDGFDSVNGSIILKKLSNYLGINPDRIKKDIMERMKIIEWAKERKITDYEEFGKIIRMYYANSEELMKKMREY